MAASNDSSSNDTRDTDDPQVEPRSGLKVVEPSEAAGEAVEPGVDADTSTDTDAAQAEAETSTASQTDSPDWSEPAAADAPSAPGSSRLPWLLGVALVFAVIFALWQGQRADRFATEVERLTGELELVGAELSAHQAHLARVRVGIDDLAGRAQSLADLAHTEPGTDPEAGATTPGEGAEPLPDAEIPRITDF